MVLLHMSYVDPIIKKKLITILGRSKTFEPNAISLTTKYADAKKILSATTRGESRVHSHTDALLNKDSFGTPK